jgi:hypothetical protein
MKRLLAFAATLTLGTISLAAQSPISQTKSPKEVVEEFLRMETEGGRLTPEGWAKAGAFFVRLSPPPRDRVIVVIARNYSVDEMWVRGDRAQVYNGYEDLGRIDSSLRYRSPDKSLFKTATLYHLTLTNKHEELGLSEKTPREVAGPLEWRIEDAATVLWLTLNTATRYVTEMRDKAADPTVRENGDATIMILKRLQ